MTGTGRNGGRRHQRGRASRRACATAVRQSRGRRATRPERGPDHASQCAPSSPRATIDGGAAPGRCEPWPWCRGARLAGPAAGRLRAASESGDQPVQTAPAPRHTSFGALFDALLGNVERVIQGKREPVRLALGVPVRRGAPAHRGRPRRRQDVDGEGDRPVHRRDLEPDPVHARPAAVRRHRGVGVEPGRQRVRVPPRRRVRQRRPRRRDQPGVAQDAVRAARGDGGAARSRWTRTPTGCRARSW